MKLSKTQQGILNAEIIAGAEVSNICGATMFPCAFTIGRIIDAVNTVVKINDALRIQIDIKTKTQKVIGFQYKDYNTLHFVSWNDFCQYAEEYATSPLDKTVSLFECIVFTVEDNIGILYKLHHTICDAWSLSVLRWQLREIIEFGKIPEAKSIIDYLKKERLYIGSRRYNRDSRYFISQYNNNKDRLLIPSHNIKSYDSDSVVLSVGGILSNKLISYAASMETSLFPLLLSAYSIYYSKTHYNAECFYIGTTVLNRTSDEEMKTIGPFIDSIPLMIEVNGDKSIENHISSVEESVMNAFRHQKYNYPMLQEVIQQTSTEIQLFDVILSYQAEYEVIEGYKAKWFQNGKQIEPLQIHFDHRNGEEFEVTYCYLTDVYSHDDIMKMHEHFMNSLQHMISDKWQLIRDFDFLSEQDKNRLLTFSLGDVVEYQDKSMYQLVDMQTDGLIIEGNKRYTINELKRDAERIDAHIHGQKRVIGVLCDRGYLELAAIYGIIRGGNAYMPISPDYPLARIKLMLEISKCCTVLAEKKYQHLIKNSLAIEDLLMDEKPTKIPNIEASPEDSLYVIFTSGSTGIPKGAMVSNRSAVNRIRWMVNRYFTAATTVMLKTPYTFDVSVWEIFGFALGGFSLYILPPEAHFKMQQVSDYIKEGQVTDIHFVPSVFRQFLKEGRDSFYTLKNVFLSGEALTASLIDQYPCKIHNLYGPTECAVDVTYYECNGNEKDPVPIGRPIDNCQMLVLDHYLKMVPVGIPGQICIGGCPTGLGYINNDQLTANRFVDNPYGEGKLYLTGDLGYWRQDGQLIYIGREDTQVKINGQRIEIGEIEAALSEYVESCAVIVEDNRLIAFYTGINNQKLRDQLGNILPHHMIPNVFVHVDEIPLTSNGKVNRAALMIPNILPEVYEPPQNETEKQICNLFEEILEVDKIGRNDNFYDLGGTSLNIIELLAHKPLSNLSAADFMKSPTPAGLTKILNNRGFTKPITMLYEPQDASCAYVLFPYAGGDSKAFTALLEEFRQRGIPVALYCVEWGCEYNKVENELHFLSQKYALRFYSHCAGVVMAMKLLKHVDNIDRFVIGANIPIPGRKNVWKNMSDAMIFTVLNHAGMPSVPETEMTDVIKRFRNNTDEYFEYFDTEVIPSKYSATIVLSKNDPLTPEYLESKHYWTNYLSNVDNVCYIDSVGHYFQSTNALDLTNILMEEH